mmetsp:Transcript_107566/g.335391  ORF Transcript_107566/g.335391 Transcript_107566/m.335391 type:complete len:205 (+) Transcript_107566:1664-2278(+)
MGAECHICWWAGPRALQGGREQVCNHGGCLPDVEVQTVVRGCVREATQSSSNLQSEHRLHLPASPPRQEADRRHQLRQPASRTSTAARQAAALPCGTAPPEGAVPLARAFGVVVPLAIDRSTLRLGDTTRSTAGLLDRSPGAGPGIGARSCPQALAAAGGLRALPVHGQSHCRRRGASALAGSRSFGRSRGLQWFDGTKAGLRR